MYSDGHNLQKQQRTINDTYIDVNVHQNGRNSITYIYIIHEGHMEFAYFIAVNVDIFWFQSGRILEY